MVEVPVGLLHDEDAIAQLMAAEGICPNERDLVIRLKLYDFEDEPQA